MVDAKAKTHLKGVRLQLSNFTKQFQSDFHDKADAMPEFEKKEAEARVAKYTALEDELEHCVKIIDDGIFQLSKKVKENLRTEQNPEGLLISNESDYLDCLEYKKQTFLDLMAKDKKHWHGSRDLVVQHGEQMTIRLMTLI